MISWKKELKKTFARRDDRTLRGKVGTINAVNPPNFLVGGDQRIDDFLLSAVNEIQSP